MWSNDMDTLRHGESGTVVILFHAKLIFWEPVKPFLSPVPVRRELMSLAMVLIVFDTGVGAWV